MHLRVGDYRTRSVSAGDLARCGRLRSLDVPIAALPPLPQPVEHQDGSGPPSPGDEVVGGGLLPSSLTLLRLRDAPITDESMVDWVYQQALARTGLLDISSNRDDATVATPRLTVILPRAVGAAADQAAREWVAHSAVAHKLEKKGVRLVSGQEDWVDGWEGEDGGFWVGWEAVRGAVERRYGAIEA